MKITIDTAHDSETDIRKVIVLLSTLVDRGEGTDSAPGEPRMAIGGDENVFSLFDQPAAAGEKEKTDEKTGAQEGAEKAEPFKIDGLERY